MSLGIRFLVAAGVFALLFVLGRISPSLIEKVSGIWTKNINLERAADLLKELFREAVPF